MCVCVCVCVCVESDPCALAGLLHMSLDKFEGARQILQPILNNFSQYNDAMANLGLTHLCNNDLAEATRNFQTGSGLGFSFRF